MAPAATPGLVCITGMHRSGTSVVTRLAQLAGADLGDPARLLPPGRDNPKGYWELRAVKELDDELLAHLGGSWDVPPTMPSGWELAQDLEPFRVRAAGILEDVFGRDPAGPQAFKDPRLCLLLPFWSTVRSITATILVVRDPREVAASLAARNAIEPAQAHLLWLRHLLAAIAGPVTPTIVRHRDALTDPAQVVSFLAAALGLPEPDDALLDEARAHLDPSLHHHRDAPGPGRSPVEELAVQVWNDGSIDADAVTPLVGRALAEGWLRPPSDSDLLARTRAKMVKMQETMRRRAAAAT